MPSNVRAISTNPVILPRLTPFAILDILIAACLIYQFLMAVRGRRAAHILMGTGDGFRHLFRGFSPRPELMRSTMAYLAPYAPFALIVLFQSEIRRLLARLGGLAAGF